MNSERLTPASLSPSQPALDRAVGRAAGALAALQRVDGHFVFDLEADAAISAEYILLKHYLDERDPPMEAKVAAYLRRTQEKHGGWPMLAHGGLNLSASVKAYFALKAVGDAVDAPHMLRARDAILAAGGAVNVNMFTRITLAFFGVVPWRAVPVMPVELMHAPDWFPIHIYRLSYWARATLVPLLVLMALKVQARNPQQVGVEELFVVPAHRVRRWPRKENQTGVLGAAFGILDQVLRRLEPFSPTRWREAAIRKAVAFVRERLNGEDGLGAIFPSMVNTVMMFRALGVPDDDPDVLVAKAAVEKLVTVHGDEAFCQPCVSPVWDTALATHALLEADPSRSAPIRAGLDWLKRHQVLDVRGDWSHQRPQLRPGGWAFQYNNPHYPDLDDTAVIVMAFDRARLMQTQDGDDEAIARACEWVLGMQSADGGWASFDADNTSFHLNAIPFADHGALLDPPTADVTARCVSMLAQLGHRLETSDALRRGVEYLLAQQTQDGSWFGRWGINYVYGTWSVLCALNAVGFAPDHPAVRRGADWLEAIQNRDGGWGEDDAGYARDYLQFRSSPSTASQTAWALLGLMAAGRVDTPAVRDGVAYLVETQQQHGFWAEDRYTAVGFPRVFYLRYDGYPKFFPLMALARFRNIQAGNAGPTLLGM